MSAFDALDAELRARITRPGDAGYDEARLAWNLAVDQRPALVARPRSVDDVQAFVHAAAADGLHVAPQSTGHGAAALADSSLAHAVLIRMDGITGVTIDPDAGTARVVGGTVWRDVVTAAEAHGLTAAHGSAGDVAVAGYALSGGLSFYARRHGLAVNHVRAIEVVGADGELRRATPTENPELFWALRGASGAFGVVTALELDLLPYPEVTAGMLLWDIAQAPAVLDAWIAWTESAPESATTSFRLINFPPLPELPPFLAGRSLVVIDGVLLDDDADALLAPLRALSPEMDTFATIPASGVLEMHMDPPEPSPGVGAGAVLGPLDTAGRAALLATASPETGVFFAELRQLGGAIARPSGSPGAVTSSAGSFGLYVIGMAPVPEAIGPGLAAVRAAVASMAPWTIDSLLLTFVEGGTPRTHGYGASAARLAELKAAFDPTGMFIGGHPVS